MAAENSQNRVNDKFPNLESEVARSLWPTPTATMYKGSSKNAMVRKSGKSRERDRLDFAAEKGTGSLNPTWVEWLMGFPLDWLDLDGYQNPELDGLPKEYLTGFPNLKPSETQ